MTPILESFLHALTDQTRFRGARPPAPSNPEWTGPFTPWIGFLIGLAAGLVFLAVGRIFPLWISLMLVTGSVLWLTGGKPETGLHRHWGGQFGATLGVLIVVALRISAWEILHRLGNGWLLGAMVAGHGLSRSASVLLCAAESPAASNSAIQWGAIRSSVSWQLPVWFLPLAWLGPGPWLAGILTVIWTLVALGIGFHRRRSLETPKCPVAVVPLAETSFYLALVAYGR
jgi:cobalamin synthase